MFEINDVVESNWNRYVIIKDQGDGKYLGRPFHLDGEPERGNPHGVSIIGDRYRKLGRIGKEFSFSDSKWLIKNSPHASADGELL